LAVEAGAGYESKAAIDSQGDKGMRLDVLETLRRLEEAIVGGDSGLTTDLLCLLRDEEIRRREAKQAEGHSLRYGPDDHGMQVDE
jgi:hypothetical protein